MGCGVCNHTGNCPQKDDADEIVNKMINADVIVMASPVYFYTISAQMKTLIDRTCAKHRQIKNKEFYFILTAADSRPESLIRSIECFRGFTSCLINPVEKGIINANSAWNMGDINENKAIEEAYRMGLKI